MGCKKEEKQGPHANGCAGQVEVCGRYGQKQAETDAHAMDLDTCDKQIPDRTSEAHRSYSTHSKLQHD